MIFKPGDRRKILLAGVFVSALLLSVMAFVFLIGEQNALFEKRLTLYTKVTNAKNLKVGAPIQLKGIKVGTVSTMEFENVETLVITFRIAAKYQPWVKKDSYVAFKTMGVLGDRFLEILGGTEESQPIDDEGELNTQVGPEMDQFISKGGDVLASGTKTLERLHVILEALDERRLNSILNNLDQTTKGTSELMKALDGKKLSTTMANMEKTSANLAELTTRVKEGPGTVHSLIYDPTVYDDLQALLGGAKRNKVLNYFIRESVKKGQ